MRLGTLYGDKSPNATLELFLPQPGGREVIVYVDPDLKGRVWKALRGKNPEYTPEEVFSFVKAELEAKQRGLVIRPEYLNVIEITDYIGHLNGLWPNPEYRPVKFEVTPGMGVVVSVPQKEQRVTVNTNALRIIHNDYKEGWEVLHTIGVLATLYKERGIQFVIPTEITLRRLRYIIRERSLCHPDNESASWAKINKPYAGMDWRTTLDGALEEPAASSAAYSSRFVDPFGRSYFTISNLPNYHHS